MKYICLGYMNEEIWETIPESEQNKFMDDCFAYDQELRKSGHMVGGEALEDARNAATLRWNGAKVTVTDGPFAETKEQIGGILILEAKDLNHAIRLLSKHPSLPAGRGGGSWEIRPAADLTALMVESQKRQNK
ncbi:YciI family protein [Membranihabitans maritimus]|uniref:YciI family protein n=1 Tax=Membranihabitans maritimus TaxID=2904244 RepID=UPI001F21C90B|nr:YciI family protein [Membranihabitans maritimus]